MNAACSAFTKAGSDDFNIASLTREALYGLQHRGQVSAGITVNNNEKFYYRKRIRYGVRGL